MKEAIQKAIYKLEKYFKDWEGTIKGNERLSFVQTLKDEIQGMEEEHNRIIESWKKEEILWTKEIVRLEENNKQLVEIHNNVAISLYNERLKKDCPGCHPYGSGTPCKKHQKEIVK